MHGLHHDAKVEQLDRWRLVGGAREEGGEEDGREGRRLGGRKKRVGWEGCMEFYHY